MKKLARLIPAAAVLVDFKNDRQSNRFLSDGFKGMVNPSVEMRIVR